MAGVQIFTLGGKMQSLNIPSILPGFSQVLGAAVPSPGRARGSLDSSPIPGVRLQRGISSGEQGHGWSTPSHKLPWLGVARCPWHLPAWLTGGMEWVPGSLQDRTTGDTGLWQHHQPGVCLQPRGSVCHKPLSHYPGLFLPPGAGSLGHSQLLIAVIRPS